MCAKGWRTNLQIGNDNEQDQLWLHKPHKIRRDMNSRTRSDVASTAAEDPAHLERPHKIQRAAQDPVERRFAD